MGRKKPRRARSARAHQLPPHPRGGRWNARHVTAARLRAAGKAWAEVAAEVRVREDTAKHYPGLCVGWDVLLEHYRAQHLADLEDALVAPALEALRDIVSDRDASAFARIQAAQVILGERRAAKKAIDLLVTAKSHLGTDEERPGGSLEVDLSIVSSDG